MRYLSLIVVLLLSLLLPLSVTHAQTSGNNIILVYNNLADSLVVFDGRSGETTELITADDTRRYEYEIDLSPTQEYVAVYTLSFDKGAINRAEYETFTYTLDVFSLPNGENVLSHDLIPAGYEYRTGAEDGTPGDPSYELPESFGEMAWSQDGRQLAFVAGVSDAEANVFIFDTATEDVTELPDEAGYPNRLRWSPDDSQIAYVAVESFLADTGKIGNSVYIVATDGASSTTLDLDASTEFIWLIDWSDDSHLLWSPFDVRSGAAGLNLYDVDAESSVEVIGAEQLISIPVWDASAEVVAFAVPLLSRDEDAPTQSGLTPGAYALRDLGGEPELLLAGDNLYGVQFILSGYLSVGNDVIWQMEANQEISLSELRRPDYSPNGEYALGERTSQTYLRNLDSAEEDLIAQLYYVDGQWLDDETFIAQVGAYGSVIGLGSVGGRFTNLVDDVSDGPFVGFAP